jgi:ATP-binding cassette, subfamily B, multidrug efflux pump
MLNKLISGQKFSSSSPIKNYLEMGIWQLTFHQIRHFFFYYVAALSCLVALHTIQSELPYVAKEVAELIEQKKPYPDMWVFALFCVGIIFFRTASRLLFFFPARVMERDMRVFLMGKVEDSVPFRYDSIKKGQIFQCIYSDIEQLRAFIGFALLQVGNVIIACAILLPKLASFHPDLVIALLPMLLSLILFTIIVGSLKKMQRKAMDAQAIVQNTIIETYNGKSTIKNFHAEKPFIELFKKYSFKELINFYYSGIGVSFSVPLIPLGVGVSLIWGGYIIYQNDLGASSLVFFSGFTFLFLEPLSFMSWIGVVYISSVSAWGRIRELVDSLNTTSETEKNLIRLYDKQSRESQVVEDSFDIHLWGGDQVYKYKKNSINGVIGITGSGKTELLRRLSFCLKLNNKKISYTAQVPYVYDDTFENNIFMGRQASGSERLLLGKLVSLFGLNELTGSFDDLLKLPLGENGKRLSGGQIKRMCLIRSLMGDAEYIIWDDPFSSVDLILEKTIMDELKSFGLLKNKTVILTSHRMSTIKFCHTVSIVETKKGITEFSEGEELLSPTVMKFFEKQRVKSE